MEWMKTIGDTINYIEDHILDEIDIGEIGRRENISPIYLQKGFTMLCGYTLGEYIRNRRLTLAGRDVLFTDATILDIALKYGYDSQDSFTKAFHRFHGILPSTARKEARALKTFAPLRISISLKGGFPMDFRIERKEEFTVLANSRLFDYDAPKDRIPAFWGEHFEKGLGRFVMGEYGICIDTDLKGDKFEYLIADKYDGKKEVMDGLKTLTIPAFDWAVFTSIGPVPETLQSLNDRIFSEWLPSERCYEIAAGYSVEYYDDPTKYEGGMRNPKYKCEIWIPVKTRK